MSADLSVGDLLQSATRGRIGVDQRLIRSILDHGAAAVPEILAFSRSDHRRDRINLDPVLVDLVHSLNVPQGLEVLLDVIRRDPDEIDEDLIAALLPFREQAIEPLLALYEEI